MIVIKIDIWVYAKDFVWI